MGCIMAGTETRAGASRPPADPAPAGATQHPGTGAPSPEKLAADYADLQVFGLCCDDKTKRARTSEAGPIYALNGSESGDSLRWVF